MNHAIHAGQAARRTGPLAVRSCSGLSRRESRWETRHEEAVDCCDTEPRIAAGTAGIRVSGQMTAVVSLPPAVMGAMCAAPELGPRGLDHGNWCWDAFALVALVGPLVLTLPFDAVSAVGIAEEAQADDEAFRRRTERLRG